MKNIVFVYGLCGIGKTSLLRTFGPRTAPHELAPQIPAGIIAFAVDQERAGGPAQKAGVILEKIKKIDVGLIAVDIPQMHIKYYKDFESLDGSVHHVLLDEKEEVVRERLLRRNPKRDLVKAMRDREDLRRKAASYGWPIMSQNEIADFLKGLVDGRLHSPN
jgi:hypothetical protein